MKKIIFICFSIIFFSSPIYAMFEYRPITSRAVGMGGAMLPVANDASAVFFNPAGLSNGPYAEVSLFSHHIFGVNNITENFVGISSTYKQMGAGFNFLSTGITGVYTENQLLFGFGMAIFSKLQAGASFKMLSVKYGGATIKNNFNNADIGFIYSIKNTNFAFKLRNIIPLKNSGKLLVSTPDKMLNKDSVFAAEAGVSRTFFKNTTISIAFHNISDPENSFHTGLEYGIYGLYFRMGMMPHIFTGGIGFDRKIVALDISFENVENIGLFYYATLRMKIE